MRKPIRPAKPVVHAPLCVDWTDEKLRSLSQEQLLSLLSNLDRQRLIGRVGDEVAATFEPRITSLLSARNSAKRRKQAANFAPPDAQGAAVGEP